MIRNCIICSKEFCSNRNKKTCSSLCKTKKNTMNTKKYRLRNPEQYKQTVRNTESKRNRQKRAIRARELYKLNNGAEKRLKWSRNNKEKELVNWRSKDQRIRKNPERMARKRLTLNAYKKKKYWTDPKQMVKERIKANVRLALKKYSIEGKVKSCKKYGINYEKIYKHLGTKPGIDYEIDHVIPLALFNFNRPEEIKAAFTPSNHQWLEKSLNRSKQDRLLLNVLELDIKK